MKQISRRNKMLLLIALLSAILLAITQDVRFAQAQKGGGYDLTWNVITNGGTTSTIGGAYSLNGTIGQAGAAIVPMIGGLYSMNGGFWLAFGSPGSSLYLPLILR